MGFYFERFRAMTSCTADQANTDECFLGFEPVVRRFMLEMDGKCSRQRDCLSAAPPFQ